MSARSEAIFFEEKEDVLRQLGIICRVEEEEEEETEGEKAGEAGAGEGRTLELERAWETTKTALEGYQEQPVLLDPHLEELMGMLMTRADQLLTRIVAQVEGERAAEAGAVSARATIPPQFHAICRVVHLLCRVRGYKRILKLLTHEVEQLEKVLLVLRAQDKDDYQTWETRYTLLLWLAMLTMVPFDICSVDSTLAGSSAATADEEGEGGYGGVDMPSASSVVSDIVDTCKAHLGDSGPTRDAAAVCLASLMTRPDMEARVLDDFMEWSVRVLQDWASRGDEAAAELTRDTFLLNGTLTCQAMLFKTGHREKLVEHVDAVLPSVLEVAQQENQTLTRKFIVKICQRVGMTYLPPRVAAWRYARGHRSLVSNLRTAFEEEDGEGENAAGEGKTNAGNEEEEEEKEVDVPPQTEDVIELLLMSLRDRDTVVRWSAAKGVGRITGRLPKQLADDVVESLLALFDEAEEDGAWHGGCLALAELARRGVLLPTRLGDVVPLIVRAMSYDVLRGHHSVGSHVRDAACYVCWAFARAYSPDVMAEHTPPLCDAMILMSLFDREVNCRRAASAAFQESVGRQGHENFVHGIDVITRADYFALGNRTAAFTEIAPDIAQFERYRLPIIDHVRSVKLSHWDEDMRQASAQALRRLAAVAPQYMLDVVIPELLSNALSRSLNTRHGAVIGLAEVVRGLTEASQRGAGSDNDNDGGDDGAPIPVMPPSLEASIADVVPQLEKARLYRGRGGEVMRGASARLIESIAFACMAIPIKVQVRLTESLNENVVHPNEDIQQQAIDALRLFLATYFPVPAEPSQRLQALTTMRYLDGLRQSDVASSTRGFALALGVLPAKLVVAPAGRLREVIETLANACTPTALVGGEPDAETRRNAVRALVELVQTVGVGVCGGGCGQNGAAVAANVEENTGNGDSLPQQHGFQLDDVELVARALTQACDDYSMDKRGDIGSWVRIEALRGMEPVLRTCTAGSVGLPHESQSIPTAPPAVGSAAAADDAEHLHMPPAAERTEAAYVPDIATRVHESIVTQTAMTETGPALASTVSTFLTGDMVLTLMRAIIKQLSEKLDAVRFEAGVAFVKVLRECPVHIPFVPQRVALEGALEITCRGADNTINWSSPRHTFPLVVKLMSIPDYHHAAVSGLVVSVGGLTESVVRESTSSMLGWCRALQKANNLALLGRFSTTLVRLFGEYDHVDRVILPLLKTVSVLLNNDVFDFFKEADQRATFGKELLTALRKEMHRCGDVRKLRACADVVLGILPFGGEAREVASRLTMVLLGHSFPKVRKYTSEQLYLVLIGNDDLIEDENRMDDALELLLSTTWDGELGAARSARHQLCLIMGVPVKQKATSAEDGEQGQGEEKSGAAPSAAATATGTASASAAVPAEVAEKKEDELASYASLVRDVGY